MSGNQAWGNLFDELTRAREKKPRTKGLTMIIDKQADLRQSSDLLQIAGHIIDHCKFGFGTTVFMEETLLREKIRLFRSVGVLVYPGGTLAEAAIALGRFDHFLQRAKELGFSSIEISDGTLTIPSEQRSEAIRRSVEAGFTVITEVGKKDPSTPMTPEAIGRQILLDLEMGADKVIVEARESGRGVGVCNPDGSISKDAVEKIVDITGDADHIIWESPLKEQQVFFIERFGPNVNLGNIAPHQVFELEALRCNLRFETLSRFLARRCEIW